MDSFPSPNCMQTILNDLHLANTCWPFQQDRPPLLLDISLVLLLIVLASALLLDQFFADQTCTCTLWITLRCLQLCHLRKLPNWGIRCIQILLFTFTQWLVLFNCHKAKDLTCCLTLTNISQCLAVKPKYSLNLPYAHNLRSATLQCGCVATIKILLAKNNLYV